MTWTRHYTITRYYAFPANPSSVQPRMRIKCAQIVMSNAHHTCLVTVSKERAAPGKAVTEGTQECKGRHHLLQETLAEHERCPRPAKSHIVITDEHDSCDTPS